MLKVKFNEEIFNKIKFKNPFQQLRILRHEYSNYDEVINDNNWKQVTISFYKQIRVKYPLISNVASKWVHSKLSESVIR